MIHLVWALPALAVIGAIASGRAGTLAASLIGLLVALTVALTAAPHAFQVSDAAIALARGTWIVVPYILGGLLFWQMAIRPGDAAVPAEAVVNDSRARRRLLFAACFLIGPFAESATGFGVGIIGTMMLVRRLDVAPVYLLAFSLLSQTLILWGGMGSGAIVAAAFARADPTTLAVHASFFFVAFNLLWLPLYWRMADRAGIAASWSERLNEGMWLGASLVLLIMATALLGPETAMLAACGPLIVLRWLADERPARRDLMIAVRRMAPFAALIGWLVITRLVPALEDFPLGTGRMTPFAGAPAWSPLFHAGTWLVVAAVLTSLLRGHGSAFPTEIKKGMEGGSPRGIEHHHLLDDGQASLGFWDCRWFGARPVRGARPLGGRTHADHLGRLQRAGQQRERRQRSLHGFAGEPCHRSRFQRGRRCRPAACRGFVAQHGLAGAPVDRMQPVGYAGP